MTKPKTLTQQYNALRKKAEKALALPENAGLGLKLPKRPKKITRKSVARMENFNASVKQKNFLRSLRRQERRKISRQNYWERLRQDPQKYEEVKHRRSEGMKRYWEDLKRNKPEEYAERLAKMQRGAAEYRRKVKSGEIEKKTTQIEKEETPRSTKQREAQKKYWEDLKQNDPEKYRERIEKLQESRRKSTQGAVDETVKEEIEEILPSEVEEITPPEVEEILPEKNVQDYVNEQLEKQREEILKYYEEKEQQNVDAYVESFENTVDPTLSSLDEIFPEEIDFYNESLIDNIIFDNYNEWMMTFPDTANGVPFMQWFREQMETIFGKHGAAEILMIAAEDGILNPGVRSEWYDAESMCERAFNALSFWIKSNQHNPIFEDVMMDEDWLEDFEHYMKEEANRFDGASFTNDFKYM